MSAINFVYVQHPDEKEMIMAKNIKEKYDFVFDADKYNNHNKNGYPNVYNSIYKTLKDINGKTVTISQDTNICCASIAGLNEQYMFREGDKFYSDLRILYIDACPDLNTMDEDGDDIVSSLIGLKEINKCENKLVLNPDQIIYFGLNDYAPNDQVMLMDQIGMKYFTLERIRKSGISKVLKYIMNEFENHPVHVVIDLKAFSKKIAPCAIRNYDADVGFNMYEVKEMLTLLKNNVKSLDIVGYKLASDSENKIMAEFIKTLISEIMNIKEKKINIFNEESRFLIYRPVEQECDDDIGWYIMRFLTLEQRENILKNLEIGDIQTISIDDDDNNEQDIYISSTTASEQEHLSYYVAKSVYDKALFPDEKMIMIFELLNTPNNCVVYDK